MSYLKKEVNDEVYFLPAVYSLIILLGCAQPVIPKVPKISSISQGKSEGCR